MKKLLGFIPVYLFFYLGKTFEKISYYLDRLGFLLTEMALYHISVNLYWLSYTIQHWANLKKPFINI